MAKVGEGPAAKKYKAMLAAGKKKAPAKGDGGTSLGAAGFKGKTRKAGIDKYLEGATGSSTRKRK